MTAVWRGVAARNFRRDGFGGGRACMLCCGFPHLGHLGAQLLELVALSLALFGLRAFFRLRANGRELGLELLDLLCRFPGLRLVGFPRLSRSRTGDDRARL